MQTEILVLALIALAGCAHGSAAVATHANELQVEANNIAEDVTALGPDIATGCEYIKNMLDKGHLDEVCKVAQFAYTQAQLANRLVNRAIQAYRLTGLAGEDLERAIARARMTIDEAQSIVDELVKGVEDAAVEDLDRSDRGREGTGRQVVGPDPPGGEGGGDTGPATPGPGEAGGVSATPEAAEGRPGVKAS